MRRVIYSVAASLDGYIAGPDGDFDWIPMDPDIDWDAFISRFDTMLSGRKTYELMASGQSGADAPRIGDLCIQSHSGSSRPSIGDDCIGERSKRGPAAPRSRGEGHLADGWRYSVFQPA